MRESSVLLCLLVHQLSVLLTSRGRGTSRPATLPEEEPASRTPASPNNLLRTRAAAAPHGLQPPARRSGGTGPRRRRGRPGGMRGAGCSRGRAAPPSRGGPGPPRAGKALPVPGRPRAGERCPRRAGAAGRGAAVRQGCDRPRRCRWAPRPAPGYSPSPASGGEASSPAWPGRRRGGGGERGPRRGVPGAPPRARAAPGSRELCAPAFARRRGGLAGRRAPWLSPEGPAATATALPAAARPPQGRGGAVTRGGAGVGGRAAQVTRRRHGDLPGEPAPAALPRPSLATGCEDKSRQAGAREKNSPKPRGGAPRPCSGCGSAMRPGRHRHHRPPGRRGHRDPSHRAARPAATLKRAGRWKRRGAALLP